MDCCILVGGISVKKLYISSYISSGENLYLPLYIIKLL